MARPSERPTAEQIELAEAQIVEQSKRIDFFLTEYSVEILAQKVRDGEYVVPAYQREFTWEDRRKSRFIESLIMGLPIPFIFFWEMPDGKLEIVAIVTGVKGASILGQAAAPEEEGVSAPFGGELEMLG